MVGADLERLRLLPASQLPTALLSETRKGWPRAPRRARPFQGPAEPPGEGMDETTVGRILLILPDFAEPCKEKRNTFQHKLLQNLE